MPKRGSLVKKQELLTLLRGIMIIRIKEANGTNIGEPQVAYFDYDSLTDKLKLFLELDFAVEAGKTIKIVSVECYDELGGASKVAFQIDENKETNVNTIYTLEDLYVRMV